MKNIFWAILFGIVTVSANAQQDTAVVNLGKTSKVIFTVGDPEDLETLRHYNFNELFQDIIKKMEEKDRLKTTSADSVKDSVNVAKEEQWTTTDDDSDDNDSDSATTEEENDDDDDVQETHEWRKGHKHYEENWQTFNFDLGTNNYLSNGKFPDDSNPYAVRPWGSWYVGLSSVQRGRLAKNFFLEWGIGVNWYNFKFQEDNIKMSKDESGVHFTPDTRDLDFNKSKLTVSYVMTSLVPVLDFNDSRHRTRFWDGNKDAFRIGVGPYAAYRIGSHSKLVYDDDQKIKEKDYDSFYLNNFRYGLRLQIGYRSTDLFINYDMNDLFVSGKGPELNAISFGVIF